MVEVRKYHSDTIGHFSIANRKLSDPIFKTLNIEELKKINHDNIPLNCNVRAESGEYTVSPSMLVSFLKRRKSFGRGKMNLIGETSDGWFSQNNKIGAVAERKLIKVPGDFVDETKSGPPVLYEVIRHRYAFKDGRIINFFVSKEVDAVYYADVNKERVSLDLKLRPFHQIATPKRLERFELTAIIANFLAKGITFVFAINDKQPGVITKVVVMDDINAVTKCDNLEIFKATMIQFLYKMTNIRMKEGEFFIRKFADSGPQLYIGEEYKTAEYLIRCAVPTPVFIPSEKLEFDPSMHSILIHGKIFGGHARIEIDKLFCHMDSITVYRFRKRFYSEFLTPPQDKIFYCNQHMWKDVRRKFKQTELENSVHINPKLIKRQHSKDKHATSSEELEQIEEDCIAPEELQ